MFKLIHDAEKMRQLLENCASIFDLSVRSRPTYREQFCGIRLDKWNVTQGSSKYILITVLPLLLLYCDASAQYYNAVDQGTYFNDNAHYPDFKYQNDDKISEIVVDNKNPESVYVAGGSYATTGLLSVCEGSHAIDVNDGSGFLAKYNRCGELIWSTYIGRYAFCLALDSENGKTIIYVAGKGYPGQSFSCDGSAIPVFQAASVGANNGFIAKYLDDDTVATLLRWTYFGGTPAPGLNGNDAIYAIDIYKHHIFVTGITNSMNLFKGAQHIEDSTFEGDGDGFIAEFDSMLSTLMFFTYLGGEGNDRCHDIKVFRSGNNPVDVFVSGTTPSSHGIASGTGFDLTFNGVNDGFLCKWEDDDGDGLFTQTWGTYFGGSKNEHSRQSEVDRKGNVLLVGSTGSSDFPVTSLAFDTTYGIPGGLNSMNDAYLIKIGNNGSKLWGTYFGGNADDQGIGLALLKNQSKHYVVITGETQSKSAYFDLINPLQTLLNGDEDSQYYDSFIAVFKDQALGQQQVTFSTFLGGSNEELGAGNYFPTIAVGPYNVLYYAGATYSADIDQVVGSEFQELISEYNGGKDGFIAKLIDTNKILQYNCPSLRNAGNDFLVNDSYSEIDIFPNPFRDKFTFQIISESDQNGIMNVISAYGETMLIEKVVIKKGVNQFPIDLKSIPPGIYMVSIIQNEQVLFAKALKM